MTAKYAKYANKDFFVCLAYFAVYQFRLCIKVEHNGTNAGKERD